jgi:hypothetical protein
MMAFAQAQMMATEFSDVLLKYSLESVAVIGTLSSNQAKRSTFRSIAEALLAVHEP